MPPFLMLIAIAFVVLMVMFGNNPVDKWRAESEKYGKDPLAREINKFNEEKSKKGGEMTKYTPPPGSLTYRLPPEQAQIPARNIFNTPGSENELVRPAPDVPITEWDSPYPSHMLAPKSSLGVSSGGNTIPLKKGGTSLMPGSRQ